MPTRDAQWIRRSAQWCGRTVSTSQQIPGPEVSPVTVYAIEDVVGSNPNSLSAFILEIIKPKTLQ